MERSVDMAEQTFVFGPERNLVGTVTLPGAESGNAPDIMLLLTNAGVIPRTGPHRINVTLARHFAKLGVAALRFDLSGLGDSRRSSSRLTADEQFVADTQCAMDFARQRFGCERFLMIGFCSGGDVAQLTALSDQRLIGILLWDSYVYPPFRAKLLGLRHRARRHGLAPAFVKGVRFVRAALQARVAQAQRAGDSPVTEGPVIFGRSRMPPKEEFGAGVRELVDRGVVVCFVYSGGEPDWYNYGGQFADMYRSFGFVERVGYEYLSGSDHTLTQPASQAALTSLAEQWFLGHVVPSLKRSGDTRKLSGPPTKSLQAA